MKNTIHWEVTEQNLQQELVSEDKRWHITKTQQGEKAPQFFLSNYDLLLMPHGTGTDYRKCFETFIADCDKLTGLIEKIKIEAEIHLSALLETEREIAHEN